MDLYVKSSYYLKIKMVKYLVKNLQADGTISHHDMYDYLHLTQKGYDKAFEPVNELLLQLLSEFDGELVRTEAEGASSE